MSGARLFPSETLEVWKPDDRATDTDQKRAPLVSHPMAYRETVRKASVCATSATMSRTGAPFIDLPTIGDSHVDVACTLRVPFRYADQCAA